MKQYSKECEMKMMNIGENETEEYEKLLGEYSKIFHKNHFQVILYFLSLQLKCSLISDTSAEKVLCREPERWSNTEPIQAKNISF